MAFPEKLISLLYVSFKELLLGRFSVLALSAERDQCDFILKVQNQATKRNFGDQSETQLRDRLIVGINIPNLENKFKSPKVYPKKLTHHVLTRRQ